jgi:hypothetical protein
MHFINFTDKIHVYLTILNVYSHFYAYTYLDFFLKKKDRYFICYFATRKYVF